MFLHKARAAAAWPCAEKNRQSRPKNSSTNLPSYKEEKAKIMIQNFWFCWTITGPGGPVGSHINALLKKRVWFNGTGFNWRKGSIKGKVFKVLLPRWCKILKHDVTAPDGGNIGVSKQRNSGHVGLPNKSRGS